MKKSAFFYNLPESSIAQHPMEPRDHAKLLTLDRSTGNVGHDRFYNIGEYLRSGDALILNDTRVIPARLFGCREDTGTKVEFLLLRQKSARVWESLTGPGKRAKPGTRFRFGEGELRARVLDVVDGGNRIIEFEYNGSFFALLDKLGQVPLPHYITEDLADNDRYQTVYAKDPGSAAAPTAGLHFTPELLDRLRKLGIDIGYVTLHVGLGTFRPVKEEEIENHIMHSEHYSVPADTAELINRTKASGGRVVCVGTTSCRTLESVASKGKITACEDDTSIFIYPGYRFRCMDALITNFHLPESTLIMLVSAFAGYNNTMRAYQDAIAEHYRFYSFGDAMLVV